MPAPSVRYKILPARGAYAALNAAVADLAEGEICYATDQDRYYQKEGGVLVLTSMEEAPNDGTQYVRRNEAWEAVDVPPGTVVSNVAPVAPDNGQLWYDTEDARIFVWTGTEWADASPDAGNPTVITSDSAPGAPQDGDLWFRTSDGRMYVYYDDGASSQWVDANPATGASNWNYDGTTLTPGTAGTNVDLGTGDLSAAAGTFGSGNITLNADGSALLKSDAKNSYVTFNTSDAEGGVSLNVFNPFTSTDNLKITNGGTVKIGGTLPASPNITLRANPAAGITSFSAVSSVTTWDFGPKANSGPFYVKNSNDVGVALNNSATSWTSTSDERLKTDLTLIEDGLNKVSTLRACLGRFKTDDLNTRRSFLIAQDVQAVLPEAVSSDGTEDNLLGLRYTEVIPLLVSALHDAKDRIEALESANAALEARLSTLEGGS